jgi:hypothetical protein
MKNAVKYGHTLHSILNRKLEGFGILNDVSSTAFFFIKEKDIAEGSIFWCIVMVLA